MEFSKGNVSFKYRTVAVSHFPEVQEDIDKLKREGKLSDNETFRGYIDPLKFIVPEDFPEAKSIIIVAVFTPLMAVIFHYKNQVYELLIPPQYYRNTIIAPDVEQAFLNDIIQKEDVKLQRTTGVHLKLLAVRSGLAQYGRNNISYVDGMGTFISLYGFFTDYEFPQDDWGEITMMELCEKCKVCLRECPTGAIREENFVIDVGKCVTLYNEVLGEFPEWIEPEAHNALLGCMRCQLPCPANKNVDNKIGKLEDVTETETKRILSGDIDSEFLATLSGKLSGYAAASSEELFPIFQRNLKVLLPIDEKN